MYSLLSLITLVSIFALVLPSNPEGNSRLDRTEEGHHLYQEYYRCLEERNKLYIYKVEPQEANLYIVGQSAHLSCHVCLKPGEEPRSLRLNWRRSLPKMIGDEPVPTEDKKYVLAEDIDQLTIHDLELEESGQYTCYSKGHHIMAVYYLDVVLHEDSRLVLEWEEERRPRLEEVELQANNLLVYTHWSDWSDCDRCGNTGQRSRIGSCRVQKLNTRLPTVPDDMPSFVTYPFGLPCRSIKLPAHLASLPEIKDRPSEHLRGHCWQVCATVAAITEIKDAEGNVIEVVETGKGFYSMKDQPPTLPPLVRRDTVYGEEGHVAILECPSKRAQNGPITWQNKTAEMDPIEIRRATMGRIQFDILQRLVFKELRHEDATYYSCWLNGRHIGTVTLEVTEPVSEDTDQYPIVVGLGLGVTALSFAVYHFYKLQHASGRSMK